MSMLPLTRLWLFVLTLLCGLLSLCFLLSPAQVRRSLQGSAQSRVELAQQSATLLLANSARLWVDTATQLSSDAVLQSSLEEHQRGQAEPELLHRTVQGLAKKAAEVLKLSFIIVTDASGHVVARAGREEGVWRDAIDGYPLVADAVRGYRLDDLWMDGGVLYRMAAAPIIAPARDRYVGAVVLGQAVGDDLADQLRAAVGLDVVFLGGGRVLASSRARERVPQGLVDFATSNAGLLQGGGHSAPISLDGNAELGVLVGLPGEASSRGAALALLSAGPGGASLRSVMANLFAAAAEGDLPLWQLPVAGGTILLAFLLGLALLRAEGEGPMQRFLWGLREIVDRRSQRLDATGQRGPFREMSALVNDAIAATPAAAVSEGGFAPSLRPETVPSATPPPFATDGLPLRPSTPFPPASLEVPEPGSPFAPPSAPFAPPSAPFAPPVTTMTPPPPTMGQAHSLETPPRPSYPTPLRPALTMGGPQTGIPLPAGRTLAAEPLRGARPPYELDEPELASSRTLLDPVLEAELEASQHSQPPDLPTMQDIPQSVVQAAIEQALGSPAAPFAGTPRSGGSYRRTGAPSSAAVTPRPSTDLSEEVTAVNRVPPVSEEDELDASFRRTYQEFIVTKQRCREPVEGLTYDKFVVKLKQSREQIMRQHSCRAVRFHVYVKEGKAALKATPVTR